MLTTTTYIEKGSDFWFEMQPTAPVVIADYTGVKVEYLQSSSGDVLDTLDLTDGIVVNSGSDGWVVKLSKIITATAAEDFYSIRITLTSATQVTIKTVEKFINIK